MAAIAVIEMLSGGPPLTNATNTETRSLGHDYCDDNDEAN